MPYLGVCKRGFRILATNPAFRAQPVTIQPYLQCAFWNLPKAKRFGKPSASRKLPRRPKPNRTSTPHSKNVVKSLNFICSMGCLDN